MGTEQPPEPDPGWGRPFRRALVTIVVPFLAPFGRRSQRTLLDVSRLIFLTVAIALLLLLFVLSFVVPWVAPEPAPPAVWVLLAAAVVPLGGAWWVHRRRLPCAAGGELAKAYQQRMFLGLAFAEAPALLGFVAAFLADAAWTYLVGLAVSAVGLALVAPTDRDVARKEAELRADGCARSLREALAAPPAH